MVEKVNRSLLAETALVDSLMYQVKDFPKYDPDSLRGQKGVGIYSKMMDDEQIKVIMRFRKEATTSRDWSFEIESDELPDEEKEKRIALFEKIVVRMQGSFKQKLDVIMSAMSYGFSITEKIYELFEFDGKQWYGIKDLKKKSPSSFRFYTDGFGNIVKFEQETSTRTIELDLKKFIHFVYNRDHDDIYGRSELKEAYRSYYNKDIILKFRNIHLERFGSGFIYAQPIEGQSITVGSKEWSALQDLMNRLQTASGAILPAEVKLNVIQPQDTDAFDRALKREDEAITKALLMTNLMGFNELDKGSRSLGDSQSRVLFKLLNSEALTLAEVMNEQLFSELGALNFPDGIYPVFKLHPLSDEEKDSLIERWTKLVNAKAVEVTTTDEEKLRELMGMPEKGEKLQTTPTPQPNNMLPQNLPNDPNDPNDPNSKEKDEMMNAVLMARDKALSRVAFTVIDKKSTEVIDDKTFKVSSIMKEAVDEMVAEIKEKKLGTPEGDTDAIQKLSFSSRKLSKIKKAILRNLEEAWNLGRDQAGDEISKAKKEEFTANFVRLETKAAEYFKNKTFSTTQKLSVDAANVIKNILYNGIKYSKDFDVIEDEIYTALENEGYIDGDNDIPAHRLQTMIRTSYFESMNEARYDYFNDPELGDFIEAFTYSAILDKRTTAICETLNGRTYPKGSAEWDKYRPPNHSNCRSVLVPVTVLDTWKESKKVPKGVEPQKGFV